MAEEVIVSLSIIIAIAALLAIVARIIRQPPLIAYLVAGIVVGPLVLNLVGGADLSSASMQLFARIGVALLLFIVGLSLDFRVLKEVGSVALIGGFFQIGVTGVIGFLLLQILDFGMLPSLYLALALSLSSTVVVVKLLSDKKEIDTLHGKIALGILVVQDIVAAIAFMLIPFFDHSGEISSILYKVGGGVGLIVFVALLSIFAFGRLLHYLALHQEVLFLFGIAWALIVAAAFHLLGFSLEIGALVAGISLASSKYTLELGSKIKPLRDFFVVIFFVYFGSQLTAISTELVIQALLLSLFVLIGKPLIVMVYMRFAGYQRRTNFLTATSLAQISEFSLVLALLGFTLGHVSQDVMNLSVLVAVVTIGVSSYSIYYAHSIFKRISGLLGLFDGNKTEHVASEKKYDIVLFGYHRMGFKLYAELAKLSKSILVVDYNPRVVIDLSKRGIDCIYGDASDPDFLNELGIGKARIVISTIPETSANLAIREELKRARSKAVFMATTEQPRNALDLYHSGIDYVIVPHHLGGDYVAEMIREFKLDARKYQNAGNTHKDSLRSHRNKSTFKH